MRKILKNFLLLAIFFIGMNANANTIIVSNLSKKKTDILINKITRMYQIGFEVTQNR